MEKLDANGNGIPDLVEERLGLRTAGVEAPNEKGASQPDWLKDAISQAGDTVYAKASANKSNYSQNLEPEGINWQTVIISALLTGFVYLGAVTLWFYLAQ